MSKFSKLLIIGTLVVLTACNRPQGTEPIVDTKFPLDTEVDTTDPDEPTDPPPTEEAVATTEHPTPLPPPTESPEIIITGEPLPLLEAGSVIDIRELHMLEHNFGWALIADADGVFHILKTNHYAQTWMDISPPQPIPPDRTRVPANAHFEDRDHGWVLYNDSDLVWSTTDGGLTWQPARLDYQTRLGSMIYSLDEDHVWIFQFLDAGMQKVHVALYISDNGGETWTKLLDPMSGNEYSIQAFDKTGVYFRYPNFGWLTRNFRGVSPDIRIDVTHDGGRTWEPLTLPAPPSAPEAFANCACGLSDPTVYNELEGIVKLECNCFEGDGSYTKNYLYRTYNGGESWEIDYIPEGELHYTYKERIFIINREIYYKCELCDDYLVINTVNWDGQFSILDAWEAYGVAHNPDTDQYALVSTDDGCRTFSIIDTEVIASNSRR